MNNRLNIYACSGVGAVRAPKIEDRLVYELEGSNTLENTRAMNMLLSQINYYRSMYQYASVDKADALNKMDLYAVCYWFAKKYRNNKSMLEHIGVNIAIAVADDCFKSSSTELSDHAEKMESLISRIENETGSEEKADPETLKWWREYVVGMDMDAADRKQRVVLKDAIRRGASVSGLDQFGIDEDSDLSKFLNDAGSYFTYYRCLTRNEARRISRQAAYKWDGQKAVYDYCVNAFVGIYGTEESLIRIIDAGIMQTYERGLEQAHDELVSGAAYQTEKVGSLSVTVICAIISAIVAVLTAVIGGIIEYAKKRVEAKYKVPENTDDYILAYDDWEGGYTTTTAGGGSAKSYLLFAGIAAGAYLLFGKKL